MMPLEGRGFESLRLRQREVLTIKLVLLLFYIFNYMGFEQAVKKEQAGGLFFRRGNERKRGDRHGSAEKKSLRLRQPKAPFWVLFYFLILPLDKSMICMYYCIKSIIQCGEEMQSNFENNIPIYLQLVERLKRDIISGKISAGERLPSVRDLGFKLKVNPNTVQKALVELEEIGLVFTERTNGKFVTEDKALIEKYKQEYANIVTQKYIETMAKIGFDKNEILLHIKDLGGSE